MSGSKFCAKTFYVLMAKDGVFEELSLANKKASNSSQNRWWFTKWKTSRLILTSIKFVKENSPEIQTLIKKFHDLINERKVS